MAARFKSIEEKGGLPIHLMTVGIEAAYFYHLHELGLSNTVIQKLLFDRYHKMWHRQTIASWRKHIKGESDGQEDKSSDTASSEVG